MEKLAQFELAVSWAALAESALAMSEAGELGLAEVAAAMAVVQAAARDSDAWWPVADPAYAAVRPRPRPC
jgi:hypothetical protein